MKVFELIEKLRRCDPNATVEYECDDDWYCGEIRVVDERTERDGSKFAVLKCED